MYRRIVLRTLFALLVITGAGGMLVIATLQFGLITGEEFAPDTFQRRSYWYYELPIVRLKVSPVTRSVTRDQLATLLIARKYVTLNSPPKRWDLVHAHRGRTIWRQGDAQILGRYLQDQPTGYWETWTKDHPKLAQILWPEVAKLARKELYLVLPALFDEALRHEQPESLREQLDLLLAQQYEHLATREVGMGNLSAAVEYFTDALRHQPARPAALAGRAECYDQLGQTGQATADRQAISVTPEEPAH